MCLCNLRLSSIGHEPNKFSEPSSFAVQVSIGWQLKRIKERRECIAYYNVSLIAKPFDRRLNLT